MSDSSVMHRAGNTTVHASVVCGPMNVMPESNMLPMTVDYLEKSYALGLIPSSPDRRDRHNREFEVLAARAIDRAIRPLFPKTFYHSFQVSIVAHSNDLQNDPIVAGINAASSALLQCDKLPWQGPVGCVRVAMISGKLVLNPRIEDLELHSTLDLVYAGNREKALMIEVAASQVNEDILFQALQYAHASIQPIINAQIELHKKTAGDVVVGRTRKWIDVLPAARLQEVVNSLLYHKALATFSSAAENKLDRALEETQLRSWVSVQLDNLLASQTEPESSTWSKMSVKEAIDATIEAAFRDSILKRDPARLTRSDGRKLNEIRQISAEIDIIPGVHGSSMFGRGDTRVMCVSTISGYESTNDQRQRRYKFQLPSEANSDKNDVLFEDRFMLHYDFPPYCTNEPGSVGIANRRMIGHGKLAEKAIKAVFPTFDEFPYVVRVNSEVTGSSGSSSMASVCGASLALMHAGVPLKNPVAGISIGMVSEERPNAVSGQELNYVLISDILGSEDYHGDMDFKIAGTRDGVTAIQLDVKLEGGVSLDIIRQALESARIARNQVLLRMSSAISQPSEVVNENVMMSVKHVHVPEGKLSLLLGRFGETQKSIQSQYGVEIDTSKDGCVYVSGRNSYNLNAAVDHVSALVGDVNVGDVLQAEVTSVKDYGVIVNVLRGREGFIQVNDIADSISSFKVGDMFFARVLEVDSLTGSIKLSKKEVYNSTPTTVAKAEDAVTVTPQVVVSKPKASIIPVPKSIQMPDFAVKKKEANKSNGHQSLNLDVMSQEFGDMLQSPTSKAKKSTNLVVSDDLSPAVKSRLASAKQTKEKPKEVLPVVKTRKRTSPKLEEFASIKANAEIVVEPIKELAPAKVELPTLGIPPPTESMPVESTKVSRLSEVKIGERKSKLSVDGLTPLPEVDAETDDDDDDDSDALNRMSKAKYRSNRFDDDEVPKNRRKQKSSPNVKKKKSNNSKTKALASVIASDEIPILGNSIPRPSRMVSNDDVGQTEGSRPRSSRAPPADDIIGSRSRSSRMA